MRENDKDSQNHDRHTQQSTKTEDDVRYVAEMHALTNLYQIVFRVNAIKETRNVGKEILLVVLFASILS